MAAAPIRGEDLVKLLEEHVGEQYVLGTLVPKNDAKWRGPWDCAEFTAWGGYQLTGKLYGCRGTDPRTANAYTGYYAEDAHAGRIHNTAGRIHIVSVDVAMRTAGALLLRVPAVTGASGHIVVSDGAGGTVEAMGTAYGVVRGKSTGRTWSMGLYLPGLTYFVRAPIVKSPTPSVLRVGNYGTAVADLQHKLNAISAKLAKPNYSVGSVDGIFGQQTGAAVVALQRDAGLVIDGEVGPQTMAVINTWSA